MNAITITVSDLANLQRRFNESPAKVHAITNKTLLNIAIDMQRAAIRNVPVYTGNLQSSITIQRSSLRYKVASNSKYAYYAHEGRKPGRMPPVRAVEGWARKKGINPFLLARAIGRKGTKGKKFFDLAFTQVEPDARRELKSMINRIVREI